MKYQEILLKKPVKIDKIVSIHYFEYAKDFTYPGERHDFWEVVYADRNPLIITAGAKDITLQPGQFFLHRPMEYHNIRCCPGMVGNAVIFSFYCDCHNLYAVAGKVMRCSDTQKNYLGLLIAEAQRTFDGPWNDPNKHLLTRKEDVPFAAEQQISIYMEMFLIDCLRANRGKPLSSSPLQYTADPFAAEVCDYLEKHVTENIDFDMLCEHFSVSASKLKVLFREQVGCGVMAYFSRCKIDCAKHLIRAKEKNLSQIAEYLGYSSLPYFSRQFKNLTGMTPTQYASTVQDYGRTDNIGSGY